jgi:hypothetical protein
MLVSLLLSGLLALNPFRAAPRVPFVAPVAVPAGSIDPCQIYGSIYLETDPSRRSYCFATVYLEPEEAFADLMVYKEDNKLFADKAGFWSPASTRDFADYVLYVTDKRALADFYIHYTDSRSFAGCRKQ